MKTNDKSKTFNLKSAEEVKNFTSFAMFLDGISALNNVKIIYIITICI